MFGALPHQGVHRQCTEEPPTSITAATNAPVALARPCSSQTNSSQPFCCGVFVRQIHQLMTMEKVTRAESRTDEPGDEPPAPRQREVRPNSTKPGAESVRDTLYIACAKCVCVCVALKGRSDHYHREASQPMDGDVTRIQMDFMSLVQKEHSSMNRERTREFS